MSTLPEVIQVLKNGPAPSSSYKKTKKSGQTTNKSLTDLQKKGLAAEVKKHPVIWSLAHELHKFPDAHAAAWSDISREININVDECKKAWKSLRNSLKYHMKKFAGKSGDSGDEGESQLLEFSDTLNDEALQSWEFYDDLKFLTEKSKRMTTGTGITDSGTAGLSPLMVNVEDDILTPNQVSPISTSYSTSNSTSKYSYMTTKRKKDTRGEEELLDGINELVKLRKMEMTSDPNEELRYKSMYVNLDRMLKKLPEEVVEELNFKFITLTFDELKNSRDVVLLNFTE